MEKQSLIEKSGLTETKLNSELNRVGLLPQFEHLGISAASTTIPQEIVNFILEQGKPKQLKGQIASTRKTNKSQVAIDDKTEELSIQSMSLDVAALDEMDANELESLAAAIDNQRESVKRQQNNAYSTKEGLTSEALIQRETEGMLSGELEAVTFLKARHNRFQEVLADYGHYESANHNRYVQGLLNKGNQISSDESDTRSKNLAESQAKMTDFRQTLFSKFKR